MAEKREERSISEIILSHQLQKILKKCCCENCNDFKSRANCEGCHNLSHHHKIRRHLANTAIIDLVGALLNIGVQYLRDKLTKPSCETCEMRDVLCQKCDNFSEYVGYIVGPKAQIKNQ